MYTRVKCLVFDQLALIRLLHLPPPSLPPAALPLSHRLRQHLLQLATAGSSSSSSSERGPSMATWCTSRATIRADHSLRLTLPPVAQPATIQHPRHSHRRPCKSPPPPLPVVALARQLGRGAYQELATIALCQRSIKGELMHEQLLHASLY